MPGAAPEGSSGRSHLHPAALGFLSQSCWGIQQRSLNVQYEREQGKRLVNDLRSDEIYVMCHFPPFSFLSSA